MLAWWVGLDLHGTLLEELQSLAGSAAVSAKWQLAHDFGDLRHMREMTRPSFVDVLLQLLLNRGRCALRQRGTTRERAYGCRCRQGEAPEVQYLGHRLQQLPRAPVWRHAAQRRQLADERVLVETMLRVQASQAEEEVLLPSPVHAAEEAC